MADCPREHSALRAKTDFLSWSERDEIRKAVFDRDPPLCVWCQCRLGGYRSENYYQADHIIPRAEGGAFSQENIALACKRCNTARGNKGIIEFLVSRK